MTLPPACHRAFVALKITLRHEELADGKAHFLAPPPPGEEPESRIQYGGLCQLLESEERANAGNTSPLQNPQGGQESLNLLFCCALLSSLDFALI